MTAEAQAREISKRCFAEAHVITAFSQPDVGVLCTACAAAALASRDAEVERLKEELAKHEHCIEEIQADELKVAERENELHDEADHKIATLRAQHAALVEALSYFATLCEVPVRVPDIQRGGILEIRDCGYCRTCHARAALAAAKGKKGMEG